MYTAKIIQKIQEPTTRQWIVDVEFSNGTDTFIEAIRPQDKQGFNHWLQSRLQSLNGLTDLIEEDNLNKTIEVATPTPPTQTELDKAEWLRDFGRLQQIQRLIDLQVLTGTEAPVVNLRNKVKTNFKPAYVADM